MRDVFVAQQRVEREQKIDFQIAHTMRQVQRPDFDPTNVKVTDSAAFFQGEVKASPAGDRIGYQDAFSRHRPFGSISRSDSGSQSPPSGL
jgi:hypothetical protein